MDPRVRPRCPASACAICLSALALTSSPALAASFRASYVAPEACPDREAFIRAVEKRLPGWKHDETSAERSVQVHVQSTPAGFIGTVSLDQTRSVREIDGPRCDAVVRGLALVAAVALDPTSAVTTEPAEDPPAQQPRPAAPPAPPSPPALVGPALPQQTRAAKPARLSFGFGAAGGILFGPAPSALYGVEVRGLVADSDRRFVAHLGAGRLVNGDVAVTSGRASFELTYAELAGCYRPIRGSVLAVSTCLTLQAGSLAASGEPTPPLVEPKTSRQLWAAAGGRIELAFPLGRNLELGAGAGAGTPFRKYEYLFENPDEEVHESAIVGADLRAGINAFFP
jgi:hypothetical protein